MISKTEYDAKGSFFELCHNLMVLPIVSFSRIESMVELLDVNFKSDSERKMLSYFKANYLHGNYHVELWNLRSTAIKTNNWMESFHSMLNRLIHIHHPSIHILIPHLNKIIEDERKNLFEVRIKNNVKTKKKQYLMVFRKMLLTFDQLIKSSNQFLMIWSFDQKMLFSSNLVKKFDQIMIFMSGI